MRVLLASPRGVCAGVDRAVATVEVALDRFGSPVFVRRHIVHNTFTVNRLRRRGAVFIEELSEVPDGATVIFSAHGVAPDVRAEAARRHLRTIDATCPLVTKVHREARRFAADDYDILLVGQPGHDEVVGTVGEAPDHIQVVADPDAARTVQVRDPSKVAWVSQTTLAVEEAAATAAVLRERFPRLVDPPREDICYAAHNRQAAVRTIAPHCDLVLVVGSPHSHNSSRLVEVALTAGAPAARLVDGVDAVDDGWLTGVTTVGLTGGASAPEAQIAGVLDWLMAHGYDDVREIGSIEERQVFAMPTELRPANHVSERAGAAASGLRSAATREDVA
jgi:4-hydroxy-3-methylbut-2-enyl diphosphate reductase